MPYIIVRSDGAFVARSGNPSSYTRALQHARTWPTREAADRERCPENETVQSVDEAMQRS